jgi:predicted nucleic acid-binding protein
VDSNLKLNNNNAPDEVHAGDTNILDLKAMHNKMTEFTLRTKRKKSVYNESIAAKGEERISTQVLDAIEKATKKKTGIERHQNDSEPEPAMKKKKEKAVKGIDKFASKSQKM